MRCAIFCSIIDNFGDIGVCWRLARQLAAEYHLQVSLFVDDLNSFAVLAPQLKPELAVQQLGLINIHHWNSQSQLDQPYALIIEGFGCRLADHMLQQMQQQASVGQPPLWVNLEYLSAEQWVTACHAMVSIHPATGLKQIFWFPSTTPESGGLLREQDVLDARDQFQHDIQQQTEFWNQLGLITAMQFCRKISLFSYENNAITDLLTALAHDCVSTLLLVPQSKSLPDIEKWFGQQGLNHTFQPGYQYTFAKLTIAVLPFLPQIQYDQLLWACDLNFVRGEDSCVRAQWAAQPFIWHIYPQDEHAHLTKLHAWMDQIDLQLCAADRQYLQSWRVAMQAWNGEISSSPALWYQLLADLSVWKIPMTVWCDYLSGQSDLATRLMNWVGTQINLP